MSLRTTVGSLVSNQVAFTEREGVAFVKKKTRDPTDMHRVPLSPFTAFTGREGGSLRPPAASLGALQAAGKTRDPAHVGRVPTLWATPCVNPACGPVCKSRDPRPPASPYSAPPRAGSGPSLHAQGSRLGTLRTTVGSLLFENRFSRSQEITHSFTISTREIQLLRQKVEHLREGRSAQLIFNELDS